MLRRAAEYMGEEGRGGCPTPGYGKFSLTHTKSINAHRLMRLLKFGNIPKGICVLHRCDNRWCVNPKHLFLGTKGDNARDCVSKNRNSCGERNGLAKLTSKEVIEIRARYKGVRGDLTRLSKQYRVSICTIWDIVTNRHWRHLLPTTTKPLDVHS